MLSACALVCENVCESPLISMVCLFSIYTVTRAHTCMRPSFLTDEIKLYPQCVFPCDCSSSTASAAFLHGFCGSERQESFFVLLCIPVMPEYECISRRPFMHCFSSFSYFTHAQYKCFNQACFKCFRERQRKRDTGLFCLVLSTRK